MDELNNFKESSHEVIQEKMLVLNSIGSVKSNKNG